MICRNCKAQVDDDLIFCTECGARLFEPTSEPPTVSMNDFADQRSSAAKATKSSSRLKWVALIVVLISIPASIFGLYLLMNASKNQNVTPNPTRTGTPTAAPTRKANANVNSNANSTNSNANSSNTNANSNVSKPLKPDEVMNERLEIAPKSNYARPFTVSAETAKIVGKIRILQGDKIDGFVFLKSVYDDKFADPNYKVFSFGDEKNIDLEQTLVAEEYVLVIINPGDKPVTIQANISLK